MNDLRRKTRITYLNIRIALLRITMHTEGGLTDQWKIMARNQALLIQERNHLYTQDELRGIEKKRGIR